jgi:thiol:disulfide interchange protein DsbC
MTPKTLPQLHKVVSRAVARALVAVAVVASSSAAIAQTTAAVAAKDPIAAAMEAKLKSLYPSTTISSVRVSALPNLFEVVIGKSVAYVDMSGKYFLFGHLYDMATQTDITAQRLDQLSQVDFSTLPLQDAIKTVRGTGARKIAIFSDPDCPFCKVLEKNLVSLNDVTIYTFLFPIAQLHPTAKNKALNIWCSKNKNATWEDTMLRNAAPAAAQCDHPLDRNIALAAKLGINGTPTLIAADGRLAPGAMPSEQIEAWLAGPLRTAAATTKVTP